MRVGATKTDDDSGGAWHRVIAIKMHEGFGNLKDPHAIIINDVALVRVAPPFDLTSNVTKIQLAEKGSVVIPGTTVRIAGWGSVSTKGPAIKELKSTDLQIIDSAACARAYNDRKGTKISSNHLLCAAQMGRDSCYGDSGGPLIDRDDVQVGLVSSGVGCADPKYPGIYTDVAHYRDWIRNNSRILESQEHPVEPTYPDPITNQTTTEYYQLNTNETFGIPSIWGKRFRPSESIKY